MTATLENKPKTAAPDTSLNTSFCADLTQSLISRMFMETSGRAQQPSSVDGLTVFAGCAPQPGHGSCGVQPSSCGSCAAR
jgi:hypothetical protein